MNKILEFIQNKMPLGAMVFDEGMRIIYHNSTAAKFLKRNGISRELTAGVEKKFSERQATEKNILIKDSSFGGAIKGLPADLSIWYLYSEEPYPRISVFISAKPCKGQLNVEAVVRRCNLTNKEADILRQLVRGLKNTDIALELHMKAHTVRDHLKSIYTKCGVRTKLELVRNIIT